MSRSTVLATLLLILLPGIARAQLSDRASWAAYAANAYQVVPNVTYLTASNYESKLDLYAPRNPAAPVPVVIYFHGGFWVRGSKEASALSVLPYMEMGVAVVNVEYRLGRIALAPAAVEDARCALRWVLRNAEQYRFDTSRIVVTGGSAGGHLSLTTGMLTPEAGLDARCPGPEPMRVAGIINWYGVTDVGDLLGGPNRRDPVIEWMGGNPNAMEIAKRVSPMEYVRRDLPPILTIHGDADPTVPYEHAVRLHRALDAAGAENELLTIPGGRHGGFTLPETVQIFDRIQQFFEENGILERPQ